MLPEVRELLGRAREQLAALDPYQWSGVEAWIASVRPLLVSALPVQVEGFDRVTATPRWDSSPLFSSTDVYGRRRDNFAEAAQVDATANRAIASAAKATILAFVDTLLLLPASTSPPSHGAAVVVHNYGDAQVGDKYVANISHSNVGAAAVGAGAVATGSITAQDRHRTELKAAQAALIRDQDALDELDARLYEALSQFLRVAREIQVEQASLSQRRARMKEAFDEIWAGQVAQGLKVQVIPKALDVAKALAENPVMAEVVKKLLGA